MTFASLLVALALLSVVDPSPILDPSSDILEDLDPSPSPMPGASTSPRPYSLEWYYRLGEDVSDPPESSYEFM